MREAAAEIEAIIRPRELTTTQYIVSNWDPVVGQQFILGIEAGECFGRFSNGSFTEEVTASLTGSQLWTHVAAIRDSSAGEARFYIDGELRGVAPLSNPGLSNPTSALVMGMSSNFGSPFDGLIAEIRVSDTALDPAEFLPGPRSRSGRLDSLFDPNGAALDAYAGPGVAIDGQG